MKPRRAEDHVHGLDGPVVVVPARVAAILVRRAGLADYHRKHRGEDAELDAVLVALRVAGLAWAEQTGATEGGRSRARRAEPGTSSESKLSTAQAASRIGCTPRAVRLAADAGRLPAVMVGGRWVLDPADVDRYRTKRAG